VWDDARREFVAEQGGRWHDHAQRAMMGMSSPEWSQYVHDQLGVELPPEEISEQVVARLAGLYRERLPLLPGAREAVERIAKRWPLGLASSSNRELIDLVLETSGLAPYFSVTVSSDEVARGKPAPDVYLEAARLLGVLPDRCTAIEDSHIGIASAAAAGMRVITVPNRDFPPGGDALAQAAVILPSLEELTVEAVTG
jgi:HAD superfamily hydrolase (TIGR01509 family)